MTIIMETVVTFSSCKMSIEVAVIYKMNEWQPCGDGPESAVWLYG